MVLSTIWIRVEQRRLGKVGSGLGMCSKVV